MEELNINTFMKKVNAYRQSRIVLTAWELDVFTYIEETNGKIKAIIEASKSDERAMRMLLDALASYGYLIKEDNTYYNSAFSKKHLIKSSPAYLSGLGHSSNLWKYWSELTQSVKKGEPYTDKSINSRDENWLENFIEAMHARAKKQAPETISLLNLEKVNSVIDIGGGPGTFSMAFVDAKPGLKATVFDLPNVIPLTKKYIIREDYQDTISTMTGDYTKDDIGIDYDLAFLSAIVHSNSFETNFKLVKKCYNALNNGGQIIISDFIMNNNRLEPQYGAEFALNMLVATQDGDTYTESEIENWFINSGFINIIKIDLPAKGAMMIAQKPE